MVKAIASLDDIQRFVCLNETHLCAAAESLRGGWGGQMGAWFWFRLLCKMELGGIDSL